MGCLLSPSKEHVLSVCHAAVPRPGVRRMGFLKLLAACAFHAAHVTHAGLAALQLPQLAVFGARVHMPLSLASIHGAAIARFLACATRPTARRDVVRDDVVESWWHPTRELAFSADGSTFVRKVPNRAAVHDTASGSVVSARQYEDTAQLATVAGGVLSGCWTGRAHQCDFLSPTAALNAVPLIDIASRVEGMCVAGTLLAVCDDRDAHITVFDLQDMTWCVWRCARPGAHTSMCSTSQTRHQTVGTVIGNLRAHTASSHASIQSGCARCITATCRASPPHSRYRIASASFVWHPARCCDALAAVCCTRHAALSFARRPTS
jgi:hypothetical protein